MMRESLDFKPVKVSDALRDKLRQLVTDLSPPREGIVPAPYPVKAAPWGPGAAEMAMAFEKKLFDLEANPETGPLFSRTFEIAIRLATIRAAGINWNNPVVTKADYAWGRDLALWSAKTLVKAATNNMADNERAGFANRIMAFLRKRKGWTEKWLIQRTLKCEVKGRDLDDILKDLEESRKIEGVQPKAKPGHVGRLPGAKYRAITPRAKGK